MVEDLNPKDQDVATSNKEESTEEDYKSKYLYLLAEMDNYRKLRDKEKEQYLNYSNEQMILSLLKVLDDFESVMKVDKDEKIKLLFDDLFSVLAARGLSKMEVVGKPFSPDIAEAMETEENPEKKGLILEEIQSGYKLNNKIIRYPKVKVAI